MPEELALLMEEEEEGAAGSSQVYEHLYSVWRIVTGGCERVVWPVSLRMVMVMMMEVMDVVKKIKYLKIAMVVPAFISLNLGKMIFDTTTAVIGKFCRKKEYMQRMCQLNRRLKLKEIK